MKRTRSLLLLFFSLMLFQTAGAAIRVTSVVAPKVGYSFDSYASDPKVLRTYISGKILQTAVDNTVWRSSIWDINNVAPRLTGMLSFVTRSQTVTARIRKDCAQVMNMKEYEEYMSTESHSGKVVVFCRRGRGKTIDELLVFKFRSDHYSSVLQITGKIQVADIPTIIRKSFS